MQLRFSPTERQAIELAAAMTDQGAEALGRLAVLQYVEMVFAESGVPDDELPAICSITPPADDLRLFADDDGTF